MRVRMRLVRRCATGLVFPAEKAMTLFDLCVLTAEEATLVMLWKLWTAQH